MDIFIRFPPGVEVRKDEIEDVLDDAIGELGEVTGGSIDAKGMTMDLDVEDDADPEEIVEMIRAGLRALGVTPEQIVLGGRP